MATFEIPLSPTPEVFSITLSGTQYSCRTNWNAIMGVWVLDLSTPEDVPVLEGIPLVAGIDLLDHDSAASPSFTDLGTTGHLYYVES